MQFNLDHAVEILSRTPYTLRSMLSGLPEEWIFNNEGDKTWSPFDVMGHLIHAERTDWLVRANIILRSGQSEPFPAFDRFAQFEESKGKSLTQLLNTFAELRAQSIASLKSMNLSAEDLAKKGEHPAFGTVDLEQLLATWVVHDLDHIVQISRTMAKQYKEAVGPWQEYLSVLKPR